MKLSGAQWTSVGLAALALGSVVVVLSTSSRPTSTETAERARNLIAVWREDEIRRVTFTSGGKSFRFERSGAASAKPGSGDDDFELHAPEREPADHAAVDRLVSGLGFATPVRRLGDGDLAALGLAKPEVSIEVVMGDSVLRLSLGKPAPSPEGAAYVSVTQGSEPTLAVVSKEVVALFRSTADDFRERTFVGVGEHDVRELALERPAGTLRLVRSGSAFRIDGKERANRDFLEPVFQALSRLDAKRFLGVAEAERARGGSPALVVRLVPTDEKAKPIVVELGGSCPGAADEIIAVARSPRARAGCVERALLGALELERERLFDREPFAARADEVETLRIERGGRRLVLTRRGPAFLLREPSEAAVALEAGNERLGAILRAPAEIVKAPDLAKLGLTPPAGRVVVTRIADDDKAVEETLLLGRTQPDGSLYARRGDDGAVLAMGRDAARAFAVDATLLKSLRVVDFTLSSLAELELSIPEHQLLRRAPSGFTLVEPPGFQHDGALATDAVLAFGSLTALRFVADADDGTFGLERPTLTALARHDADGGVRSTRLVVGRATPGGFFATVDADPSVFVVERTAVERLGTLLIDRAPFLVDPKTLARVSFTAGGVTRTLERQHEELVPAEASGIDPAVAARLIEAIGALRAEAAVHTGAPRASEGFEKPVLEVRFEPLPGLGKPRSFRVGASGTPARPFFDGSWQSAHFARAQGIEATFVIADAKLKPLLDLF